MSLSAALDKSLSHAPPTPEKIPRIEALRAAAKAFGEAIEANTPATPLSAATRARSIAITHLEDSLMHAVKSVVLE